MGLIDWFLDPRPLVRPTFSFLSLYRNTQISFKKLGENKDMVLWLHGLAPPYETPIFEVVPKCGTWLPTARAVD